MLPLCSCYRRTCSCTGRRLSRGACHRKGRVARGPEDGSMPGLHWGAASNVFAKTNLEVKPVADIIFKEPINSADALRLIRCGFA